MRKLLFVFLLAIPFVCESAAVTIDTVSVYRSGADYATLTLAEAGEQGDYVTANKAVHYILYPNPAGGYNEESVTFNGSTTNDSCNIKIMVADGYRWWKVGEDSVKCRAASDGTSNFYITVSDSFVTIQDILVDGNEQARSGLKWYEIYYSESDGDYDVARNNYGVVKRSLIRNCYYGFKPENNGGTPHPLRRWGGIYGIYNSVLHDNFHAIEISKTSVTAIHCTIVNNDVGIYRGTAGSRDWEMTTTGLDDWMEYSMDWSNTSVLNCIVGFDPDIYPSGKCWATATTGMSNDRRALGDWNRHSIYTDNTLYEDITGGAQTGWNLMNVPWDSLYLLEPPAAAFYPQEYSWAIDRCRNLSLFEDGLVKDAWGVDDISINLDIPLRGTVGALSEDYQQWDCGAYESVYSRIPDTPTVHYIKAESGDTAWDGLSPTTTLKTTIEAADSSDQVWIAAGRYEETGSISVPRGVSLYGGFVGTETSIAERGLRSDFIYRTVITDGADTLNHTFELSGENIVNGFRFVGCEYGKIHADSVAQGAAIIARASASYNLISNCIFDSCKTASQGAGLAVTPMYNGTTEVEFVIAENCSCYCGAMEILYSSLNRVYGRHWLALNNDCFGLEISFNQINSGATTECFGFEYEHHIINSLCMSNESSRVSYEPDSISHDFWGWAKNPDFVSNCAISGGWWPDLPQTCTHPYAEAITGDNDSFFHVDSLGSAAFVDSTGGDYRLKENSPYKDIGWDGVDITVFPMLECIRRFIN